MPILTRLRGTTALDAVQIKGNKFVVNPDGSITIVLPTSDPLVVGQLWNSNGTVKVSAGD